MERVQEFAYPWSKNNILVMHSDGLTTRWNLDQYPGNLGTKPPSMIAGDFCTAISAGAGRCDGPGRQGGVKTESRKKFIA